MCKSHVVILNLTENTESQLANFLVWIVMSLALYTPILTYLDFEDNVKDFSRNVRKTLGL